jgi:hypothetical protein
LHSFLSIRRIEAKRKNVERLAIRIFPILGESPAAAAIDIESMKS